MIKYKFIYNRKNKFKKDGTALVHLEIYKNRERKYISTGVFVNPEYWDSKKSRVTNSHSRSEEFNMTLHDMLQKIESVLRKGKLMERDYNVDDIVELMNHDDSPSLYDFMTSEIEKDLRIKDKTKKDLLNSRNRINEFRSDARLQQIDYRFIVDLDYVNFSLNSIYLFHELSKYTQKSIILRN